MKRFFTVAAAGILSLSMVCSVYAGTWKQEDTRPVSQDGVSNWWYQEDDGSYPSSQWKSIDGKYYYFNEEGWMLAGTMAPGNYQVDESGAMISGDTSGFGATTGYTRQEDMIQWFNNGYAILTASNSWDTSLFGGTWKSSYTRKMIADGLKSSWGVTDRASADETMNWLLTTGHRTSWKRSVAYLNPNGGDQFSLDMIAAYERKGDDGISAWDYGRALQLAAWYYLADYYTYEEALDQSLEIAKQMQPRFSSWEDMAESYLRGYEYWKRSADAYKQRKEIYDRLKNSADNPYTVDWNLNLMKTW